MSASPYSSGANGNADRVSSIVPVQLSPSTRLHSTHNDNSDQAAAFRLLLESASEHAIVTLNADRQVTYWNPGAELLFGYEAAEMLGKSGDVMFSLEDITAEVPQEELRLAATTGRADCDRWLRHKSGRPVWANGVMVPMRGGRDNGIVGYVKILRDETQKNRAAVQLASDRGDLAQALGAARNAQRLAEAATHAKDNFLAALSHELRTPLNPVLLIASEAASNPALPDDVRSRFRAIQKNVEAETHLIDDLLDVTGIAHGKTVLRIRPVDLHEVLRDAIAGIAHDCEQKRQDLRLELRAPHSLLHGDGGRLQQVFANLLRNASKFTPRGGTITVATRASGQARIEVSVTDTGIGLTAEEQRRLFEAFVQGEHAAPAGAGIYGGLGLGLFIAHGLVGLHAGSISVRSAGRGTGATVLVDLPLTPAGTAAAPPPATGETGPPARSAAILLVDDHASTRDTLAMILRRRGFEVVAARGGADALSVAASHHFDLVIADLGLPDIDGKVLMTELRERYDLPGIALSGHGLPSDVAASLAAGFGQHLTKPVPIEALDQAIARALGARA